MSGSGFIKLHRKFLDWEWYQDMPVKCLFIHCLIKANHVDKKWKGITIHRGEFVTSRETLAIETGLSEQQVRTAIQKLTISENITSTSTSKYTLIKIHNYELYQEYKPTEQPAEQPADNQQATNEQPTNNQQATTTKEPIKNEEEVKNVFKKEKINKKEKVEKAYLIFGELENVKLTDEEHQKLKAQLNGRLDHYINKLSTWLESSGNEKKSHYATILNWSLEERRASQSSQAPSQNPSWQVLKDWEKSRSEA